MFVVEIDCLGMFDEALNPLEKNPMILRKPLKKKCFHQVYMNSKRPPYGIVVVHFPHGSKLRLVHKWYKYPRETSNHHGDVEC